MANNGVDLRIDTSAQFASVMKQLKGPTGKKLRAELSKNIRAAAKPIVVDVQKEVLAIQSKVTGTSGINSGETARAVTAGSGKIQSKRSHGLRATIARAVKVKVLPTGRNVGVKIVVASAGLPEDQRGLPKYLNTRKGWRHPTFGHEPWVTQSGQPYFDPTIIKRVESVRSAIRDAIDAVIKKVGV